MRAVLKPASLNELFSLMERYPDVLPLAGGTDLLVRLRREMGRDERPLALLDGLTELQGVVATPVGLSIGAAVPLARLIREPLLERCAPLLIRAMRTIGGPAIRNMATLGGNISTASPAGDSLPVLHALAGKVELASRRGTRFVPVGEFVAGRGRTMLGEGEIITRILIPPVDSFPFQTFEKVGLRGSMAVTLVSFAGMLRLDSGGLVAEARCAWGSVASTVVRLPQLEAALTGLPLARDSINDAAAMVRAAISPLDDLRATAAYRRSVAGNLLVRFLEGIHG